MKYTENTPKDDNTTYVNYDDTAFDASNQPTEEPVITIEHDDDSSHNSMGSASGVDSSVTRLRPIRRWAMYAVSAVGAALICILAYAALRAYNYYYNIGVGISVSPKENIAKLAAMKPAAGGSTVTLRTDSVLGVALNIYELHNVRAELSLHEPDTTDSQVLMSTRSADYTVTGDYLGSLVVNGDEKQSDVWRLGYCAMVNGQMVIGISRSDAVKDYVADHRGSYFRQFMLVSNGELPRRFFLHGKVERKALARTADDHLCIVESRHPETLWGFADALREYGYVDAIYLTGGNESGFYRTPDGRVVVGANSTKRNASKHKGIAPWLVLKKQ